MNIHTAVLSVKHIDSSTAGLGDVFNFVVRGIVYTDSIGKEIIEIYNTAATAVPEFFDLELAKKMKEANLLDVTFIKYMKKQLCGEEASEYRTKIEEMLGTRLKEEYIQLYKWLDKARAAVCA